MARFMVKASEFKNVCKAVNDRKLTELKKEIIAILKKQDEKEFKKAIDYFESQELHYTHLEKSFNGKWIEKAGYGIGTVRIWKGKKYKKIAPGKWARVFEKEGRGTNIAIGKLIARVQKIDNVEDLMAFVMQNKQRFVDENGVDLPVLDKLRAAVDARNGNDGSKEKTVEDKIKENPDYPFKPKTDKERAERAAFEKDRDDFIERMDKIRQENKKKNSKPAEKTENAISDLMTIDWSETDGKDVYKVIDGYFKTDAEKKKFLKDIGGDTRINKFQKELISDVIEENNKPSEKKSPEKLLKEMGFETMEKVSYNGDKWEVAGVSLDSDGNAIGVNLTPDRQSGNLKSSNVTVDDIGKIKKEKESEAEKHQNRSDAMKGNQNAKKYGLTDDQIEYYDIQEVVEEINGYPIVKNSEGKYSFVAEGRVKDRPEDFETNITKVKERINDHYETEKNIKAAKNYDFKNAKLGSDVQYTKKNNGNHLYFKKSPDGSKVLSVTVNVSDMREPLNMVYEVSDTKTGESWQYETAYGNKEGLEWAVERPEQMEKELKKFFKRNPNKEWDKMNNGYKPELKISTNDPDKLIPIAENKSIGKDKVKMPYSKELETEISQLINFVDSKKYSSYPREFLTKVYYDNGNLVSTNATRLKTLKVGKLDGIDDGCFVDIENTKDGVVITKNEDFTKEYQFPKYEKVIPKNNNEKIVLDNKALINKIKELKKDGSITNKDKMITFDVSGNNLMLDGVKVGDLSNAKFEGENSNFFNFNVDYITDLLSGDHTEIMASKDSSAAMYVGNNNSINVIMPMTKSYNEYDSNGNNVIKLKRKNYDELRNAKIINDNEKTQKKNAKIKSNKEYVDSKIERVKETVAKPEWGEKMASGLNSWTTEQLQHLYDQANADIDKLMQSKDMKSDTFSSYVAKQFGVTPDRLIQQNYAIKQHPVIKEKIEQLLTERGVKIEKSLFDGFLLANEIMEDINDEYEDEENETEYNDYSAEQPELFNSTEMMVREALNRRFKCN